jgi:hypothetical protein
MAEQERGRMSRRVWTLGVLALLLGSALGVSACKPSARPAASIPSAATSQTTTPAVDPDLPPPNETAEHASRRLYPDLYDTAITLASDPSALRGAQPGNPVRVSRDYGQDRPVLATWVLPDDAHSISNDMFAKMRRSEMSMSAVVVPVVKNRRSISEFAMRKNTAGEWEVVGDLSEPFPSGTIHDLEAASATLRKELGPNARVRPVVFLPSGLLFAVGDGTAGEAAVLLGAVGRGSGISGFVLPTPGVGQLLSVSQLRELLNTKAKPDPMAGRNAPGGID